ncbi:hypothetical protein E2562_017704 [Oryza meyeriana var. granulata]|uniref:Protein DETOXIFICATION n=1 Tax=Oryza meyeriana var. granulata TaxID=110450 RepID=A0A6G1BXK4_9ORYZ|nr:hypothetical protein E2562_017704 [Oryza meyeriana var. granulata]
MHAVVVESLLIGVVYMALVLAFRDHIAIIYTTDVDLQCAVSKITRLLGLTMVLNTVQPVLSGVAVGGGWQGLVASINLGCYYILGLLLGYPLGYKFNLGVRAAQASAPVQKWDGTDETKPLLQENQQA